MELLPQISSIKSRFDQGTDAYTGVCPVESLVRLHSRARTGR